jgi:hypothetical protein
MLMLLLMMMTIMMMLLFCGHGFVVDDDDHDDVDAFVVMVLSIIFLELLMDPALDFVSLLHSQCLADSTFFLDRVVCTMLCFWPLS